MIGEVRKSNQQTISHVDWRANALVDGLAKRAAGEHRIPRHARDFLAGAEAGIEFAAASAGVVTRAAQRHEVTVTMADGAVVTQVHRDAIPIYGIRPSRVADQLDVDDNSTATQSGRDTGTRGTCPRPSLYGVMHVEGVDPTPARPYRPDLGSRSPDATVQVATSRRSSSAGLSVTGRRRREATAMKGKRTRHREPDAARNAAWRKANKRRSLAKAAEEALNAQFAAMRAQREAASPPPIATAALERSAPYSDTAASRPLSALEAWRAKKLLAIAAADGRVGPEPVAADAPAAKRRRLTSKTACPEVPPV